MKEEIQINPNAPTTRIARAIANINKKHIIGNPNQEEVQQWQKVIKKLASLLDEENSKPNNHSTQSPMNIASVISENKNLEPPVDFSNIKAKCFPKLHISPNFNIYFKPKKQVSHMIKVVMV